MIPDGKEQGWLRLGIDALQPWASLQGADLSKVHFGVDDKSEEKGAGIYAKENIEADDELATALLTVPRDLILSKESVEQHAKVDSDLRAVLGSLGEFGETSRIAILTFLITQATLAVPSPPESHFVHSPFASYIKFLPLEYLPTFWTEEERGLLVGTTLRPALAAKRNSLYREFHQFRTLTSSIKWIDRLWWDEVDGILSFADWMHVDAMYRSRALEFPGIGDCMVPCIDMANHAGGDDTKAIYEVDSNGDAVLLLRDGKSLAKDEEITITYGDAKGACEKLFSYGFLEDTLDSAETLFLDLPMRPNDPLAKAKMAVAKTAPGVKITQDGDDSVTWESDYIWLICTNEEDGLQFKIQRTTDGSEELKAFFKGDELQSAADLKAKLAKHEKWDIFQLRAYSVLQDRVVAQMMENCESDDQFHATAHGPNTKISTRVYGSVMCLRDLEEELLEAAGMHFEERQETLAKSWTVVDYLDAANQESPPESDEEESEEDYS